jgi:CDP-diacylglycerol--serine O-phosphatidyltransferase
MEGESRQANVLSPQNVVTLANLASGVGALLLSVAAVAQDDPMRLYQAALWIVLATVLDAVDGKLARMTGTASPLGAQLDSLADAVTFGVAPVVVASTLVQLVGDDFGIHVHPRLLVVAPIIYACCAVLRLARFNVDHAEADQLRGHDRFRGLPTPGAAGVPVGLTLAYFGIVDAKLFDPTASILWAVQSVILTLTPFLILAMALLMVSRVPYPHFFSWMTRSTRPVNTLAKFVIVLGLLLLEPELALLVAALLFAFVPPLLMVPRRLRAARRRRSGSGPGGGAA